MTTTTILHLPQKEKKSSTDQGKDPRMAHWWLFSKKMGCYVNLCKTGKKDHVTNIEPPPGAPRCVVCNEIMDANTWIYVLEEINS